MDKDNKNGSHSVSPGREEDMLRTLDRETSEAYRALQVVEDKAEDGGPDRSPAQQKKTVKIFCHKCQQKLDVTNLSPFSRIECPSCSESLLVPKWFNNYLLEEPSGAGGMAQVYRALDVALDREVAIKILKDGIRHDSVQAKRFLREAKMAAMLNHNAVIPIYTCGTWGGQTYQVTQYMTGGTLEARLKDSGGHLTDLHEILEWFHDIAEGLEHAAQHGVVHHDVKPGNILLDGDGNAKIGDFGLAQSAANPEDDSEIPDEEWVTPHYVSPERVSTGKEDEYGDVYSLGATFYHLLTGVPPFEHENLEELIWARTREMPVAPIVKRKDIPEKISSLLMEMLNCDPAGRPSYRRIISVLEDVLNDGADGPVVLQRNIILPDIDPQKGKDSLLNRSSGIHRVKSPSAILKNRKIPEQGIPLAVEESVPLPEGKDTSFLKKEKNNLLIWLISGMAFLTVIVLFFLVYAIIELIRSGL